MNLSEKINWKVKWLIEKFKDGSKYAQEEFEENILVNTGIQLMEDLLIGAGGTVFNNANAHIGVGNGTAAATASQTDLQGASKTRKAMEATYPQRSGQTLSFRSVFGSSDANYAWEEFAIFNNASAGVMLNRKVENKGTKASGETWTVTCTVTIS
jgi:hypothetical protein